MKLTPAELTVLGLLIERPRHGYDLERVIEQRGIREWTDIGFSSIYYLLSKMEKRGLVEPGEVAGTAKSRRVFHATTTGKKAATHAAHAFVEQFQPVAHPLLVGIANLPLLTERRYRAALRSRLGQVEARIAEVRETQQVQQPLPTAAREVFSYSLSLLEAERSWLATRVQVADD
ncbi:PadR family transcriptional regulator [Prauserella marina]|uniref:DNA-binding transcriptional regulator, PadR family n=1 Tax=Prauserella marina TaxID=530584 RepID=A0A222VSX9_9PSEU|nr:PadR family transcriptional regulator [Prauserella marina]ASR37045.1 PadR family transcriptional regulator [Prauserella marina]PWV79977.1 PadR family transcriptional regulator [Prauserella marina]SDD85814.1 DNA-binding transcriptional regulator, PadR family [Prauserella marina]